MDDLKSLFVIGGIAVISHALEVIMSNTGQSDKAIFLKICTYCASAFVAWEVWWKLERYVETMFGVR